jgi:hypothetical protein
MILDFRFENTNVPRETMTERLVNITLFEI